MLTQNEVDNLFDLLKTGTVANIEVAIEIAKGTQANLYLEEFDELWDYLNQQAAFGINVYQHPIKLSIAEKIAEIINLDTLVLKIKKDSPSIIPASICFLRGLKKISIIASIEVWIPHTLGYLAGLKELELALYNQTNLPSCIFELVNLEKLDLSMNLFEELPREIWKLRALKSLNLMYCMNLSELPKELFGLPRLEELYLYQTNINEISPLIAYTNIQVYSIGLDEKAKIFMANPEYGKKLLLHVNKENLFGQNFIKHLKLGTFRSQKAENVPAKILEKGIDAVKLYFQGKL